MIPETGKSKRTRREFSLAQERITQKQKNRNIFLTPETVKIPVYFLMHLDKQYFFTPFFWVSHHSLVSFNTDII